jgi:hypothetical protein
MKKIKEASHYLAQNIRHSLLIVSINGGEFEIVDASADGTSYACQEIQLPWVKQTFVRNAVINLMSELHSRSS